MGALMIDMAKDAVTDDGVFTPDQQAALCEMLDELSPLYNRSRYHAGNWPWQAGHPWRYNLGRVIFALGYRILHGRHIDRPLPIREE